MGVKKYRDKLSSGKEALYVHHYSTKYKSKRKSIRAIYNGVKLFSGKGKYYNEAHEKLFEIFYLDMKRKLEYEGSRIEEVLTVDSYFKDYAFRFLERYSGLTKKSYRVAIDYFIRFAGDIKFSQITPDLANLFKRFLSNQSGRYTNMMPSTQAKKIKQIRTIISHAMNENVCNLKSNPFKSVKIDFPTKIKNFLEPHEIEMIKNADLNPLLAAENLNPFHRDQIKVKESRDCFLLCYYMGLRYSDLKELASMLLSVKNGVLSDKRGFIDLNNRLIGKRHKKTGELSYFEISNSALKILKDNDFKIDVPSNSILNKNLKKIVEMLGINKNISIHITNHSLSTNLHEMGFSIEQIADYQGKSPDTIRKHYAQKKKLELSKKINDAMGDRE